MSKSPEYMAEEAYLLGKKSDGLLEEGVISLLKQIFADDLKLGDDNEKQEVFDKMLSRIENKEGHLRNEMDYKKLKELLHDSYLPGKHIEDINQFGKIENVKELSHFGNIVFLPKEGILYVAGDTHGDPISVEFIIKETNFKERARKANDVYLVFTGDYVNNGLNGIDNLIAVLSLKKEFPDRVILLSGNHESKESFHTALNEFFNVHWANSKEKPFLNKYPPNHYGHLRLELLQRFGSERGEEIYDLFGEWGQRLPYITFSARGTMISHSIGLPPGYMNKKIGFADLAYAKNGSTAGAKLYSSMVSSRKIDPKVVAKFMDNLGVNVFVVAHNHYRSGDVDEGGKLLTICSSAKRSPEAGHYMENEFKWERLTGKGLKEGRKGKAAAYFVMFNEEEVIEIDKEINLYRVEINLS